MPWTVAHQAPLSMGFSRQEYWSGLSCPSPADLPNPGIKPASPALAGRFFSTSAPWEAERTTRITLSPGIITVKKERQKVVNRMGTCFGRAMSKALRKEKPLLKRARAPKKAAVTEMKKEAVRKAEKVKVRKARKTPAGRANMVLTMQTR